MEDVKQKIGKRLNNNFLLLMLFILLIGIAGLICINILKGTSQKIAFEYKELDAVHDLRDAFNKTYIPAFNYLTYHNPKDLSDFNSRLDSAKIQLEYCNSLLRSSHSKELFAKFNIYLLSFEHIVANSNMLEFDVSNHETLLEQFNIIIYNANDVIEILLNETKKEIDEFIFLNKTAAKHSSITIILLVSLVIIIGYSFMIRFIKRITNPLKSLLKSTQHIMDGNYVVKSNISSKDEFEILGNSFNSMMDNLTETTISKNYFDDILKSMYDSVIVTDTNGKITLTNKASRDLLYYSKEEFNGKPITSILFNKDNSEIAFNLEHLRTKGPISNEERLYKTKTDECIPVLFSCSTVKNKAKDVIGVVFVSHDIRARKEMYRQIEKIRKNQLIEINEAQEKERLRIAQELHDSLGVILTSISYYIDNNFSNNKKGDDEFASHIQNIQQKIDAAIQESKSIAHDLIPILLKDFGLLVALENFIEDYNKHGKTMFKFSAFNIEQRFDERIEKMFYRVVQEAVNNIQKHANAKTGTIQLVKHNDFVSLIISDDGKGFDLTEVKKEINNKGIGLISMQERITAFDGEFTIDTKPGEGTEILIELPLK